MTTTPPPLGSRLSWARDFALIGAVTGFAAPAPFWWGDFAYLGACSASGAAVGALFGVVLTALLVGPLSRWPFAILLVLGLFAGAAWGASTGFLGASIAWHGEKNVANLDGFSAAAGGVAGAIQLGWFWLPYALKKAKRRSATPIVAAACAISAGLGFAALEALRAIHL